jgi:hypothetical protein
MTKQKVPASKMSFREQQGRIFERFELDRIVAGEMEWHDRHGVAPDKDAGRSLHAESRGKIWKLKSGKAQLKGGGKLKVEVKGPGLNDASVGQYNGSPDGVDAVAAAVICHGPSGATVAAQLDPVPLSKTGADLPIGVFFVLRRYFACAVLRLR